MNTVCIFLKFWDLICLFCIHREIHLVRKDHHPHDRGKRIKFSINKTELDQTSNQQKGCCFLKCSFLIPLKKYNTDFYSS